MNHHRHHFGAKAPTKEAQRAALLSALVWRRSLDGIDLESLARQHGLPFREVSAAFEAERARREARA